MSGVITRVSRQESVNYANGSKSPQSLFVLLVAFQGCCTGFDGESKLPIAGWFAKNGGEVTDADGGENIPPTVGWAGGEGIMGAIGDEAGVGAIVGSAIL